MNQGAAMIPVIVYPFPRFSELQIIVWSRKGATNWHLGRRMMHLGWRRLGFSLILDGSPQVGLDGF